LIIEPAISAGTWTSGPARCASRSRRKSAGSGIKRFAAAGILPQRSCRSPSEDVELQPAPVPLSVLYLADQSRNFPDLSVLYMAALLSRPLDEIEGGLLTTIENHAIALTVDDFLDHGAEFPKRGKKD